MKKTFTYEWTFATWDRRSAEATEYVPVDQKIGDETCQVYGSPLRGINFANMTRFPVKVEVCDSETYMTYFSDSENAAGESTGVKVPIIKITETVEE